ncbi:MAG: hypothetical protein ACOY0S_01730 [Patescibacteria group bacterium]
MIITSKTVVGVLIFGFLLILLWAKVSSKPAPSVNPQPKPSNSTTTYYDTKENTAGNVTVTVTPLKLTPGQPPQFQVVFDTHSVNLDFDVAASVSLTDDQGNSFGLVTWDGSAPGGHHRSGRLTFSQPLAPVTKSLTLTFANIASIPNRVFEWQVAP